MKPGVTLKVESIMKNSVTLAQEQSGKIPMHYMHLIHGSLVSLFFSNKSNPKALHT